MRKRLVLLLTLSAWGGYGEVELKQAIQIQQDALQNSQNEQDKGRFYYELARLYAQDQEIERAFSCFLEALKRVSQKPPLPMSQEERAIYEPALQDYLAHVSLDPTRAGRELLERYGQVASKQPSYLHLNFLIATAYANVGEYDQFFDRFYRSYPYLRESFLAYKTQGILYLRLAQRNTVKEERLAYQKEAFQYLRKALEQNTQEASLYKILIMLAKDKKDEAQVSGYLHQIVDCNVPIPRGDIYLYVKEAVDLEAFEIAQIVIDQGRTRYDYSKAIEAAQEYLNQRLKHA
jgi:tetratricopeptide (TPR) repeat protein